MSGCGPGPHSQDSWVTEQGLPARPIRQLWEAPVNRNRTSIGLDVHARSVVAAAIDSETGEVHRRRLTPDYREIEPPGMSGDFIDWKDEVLWHVPRNILLS